MMLGLNRYIRESKDELLNKVSWPTFEQLQSSTVVVLVSLFVIAGVIYLMDSILGEFIKLMYELF